MSKDHRGRILAAFEEWLDEVLTAEAPPSGLAVELLGCLEGQTDEAGEEEALGLPPEPDLYSLHAALLALGREVGLQGRAFRDLEAALRARDDTSGACEVGIEVLLDLRDQLVRGLDGAREHLRKLPAGSDSKPASPGALGLVDVTASLYKGYVLGLDRLDAALDDLGVRPLGCEGKIFDARCMRAVDLEVTDRVPAGTVLEVYRAGYLRGDEVLRMAEVKAARPPESSGGSGPGERGQESEE